MAYDRIARHEASHAVVAVVLGLPVNHVTVGKDPYCEFPKPTTLGQEQRHVMASIAGILAAEEGGKSDIEDIREIIAKLKCNHVFFDPEFYVRETRKLLEREDVKKAIDVLAKELLERESLDQNDIEQILKGEIK